MEKQLKLNNLIKLIEMVDAAWDKFTHYVDLHKDDINEKIYNKHIEDILNAYELVAYSYNADYITSSDFNNLFRVEFKQMIEKKYFLEAIYSDEEAYPNLIEVKNLNTLLI